MSTGPVSLPFVVTLRAALITSLSVIVAVADAVVIVTSPFDGLEIVASTVSVSASKSVSLVTRTVRDPVEAPSATVTVAAAPMAV